jgi:hypothetical protein
MSRNIEYATLDEIALDPLNPRLGRNAHSAGLSQEDVYQKMRDWSLEELATSFLESGFWPHEAVLCTTEKIGNDKHLVVIEGNRRIAALMRLRNAYEGVETSKRWQELIADFPRNDDLFNKIPYLRLDTRNEVDAFLGFRHVTGIKEWAPPEKAQFIAKLIDDNDLSYREVMRKIGSKTDVVERNYIAYCILTQMEGITGIDVEEVEERFSVLFLSIRTKSIQEFLGIKQKFGLNPSEVSPPIDDDHIDNLIEYSAWLFGTSETPPVVSDSRQIDKFGKVIASEDGLEYLRSSSKPSMEKAFIIAGGDQDEIHDLLSTAAYNLQDALSTLHLYSDDERILKIARLLIKNSDQVKKTLGLYSDA